MSNPNNSKVNSNLAISLSIGFLVIIVAIGILIWIQQSSNPEIPNTSSSTAIASSKNTSRSVFAISSTSASLVLNSSKTPNSSTASSTQISTLATIYQNGSFAATGQYNTPGGRESLEVTLNIKEDSIDSYSLKGAGSGTSKLYTEFFKEGIEGVIKGKKIDNISPGDTIVNGSSLTGKGFIEALNNIKNQAKN